MQSVELSALVRAAVSFLVFLATKKLWRPSLKDLPGIIVNFLLNKILDAMVILLILALFTFIGSIFKDLKTQVSDLMQEKHYQKAEALSKQVIDKLEEGPTPNTELIAWWVNKLAEIYRAQHRYNLAEVSYKKAISIYETKFGKLPSRMDLLTNGDLFSAYTDSLNSLASLYEAQKRFNLAEVSYKKALSLFEASFGEIPSDSDIGAYRDLVYNYSHSLRNLANLYTVQGRNDLAQPLNIKSLTFSLLSSRR